MPKAVSGMTQKTNTRVIATNSFSVLFDSLAPAHGCRVEIFKRARLKQRAVPRIDAFDLAGLL
jgi:hypothetical protein